ncbi:unnamed protein product [Musa textilis]
MFPEFQEAQLHLSFKKAWVTICKYIMKEDPTPFTRGQHSLENIRDIVQAQAQHRASPMRGSSILRKQKYVDGGYQAYESPYLQSSPLNHSNAPKAIFEDLKVVSTTSPMHKKNENNVPTVWEKHKDAQDPLVGGKPSLQQIPDMVKARAKHSRSTQHSRSPLSSIEIIQKLKNINDWYQVYDDPYLQSALIPHYNTMKAIFSDLRVIKDRESNLQGSSSDKQSSDKQSVRKHFIRKEMRLKIAGGTLVSFYKRGRDND